MRFLYNLLIRLFGLGVLLVGVQDRGGEAWLVGRIGEVLGFEAEGAVFAVWLVGFSADGAVEEVAGVELDAGLGGVDFHGAAGGEFVDGGG